MGHRFSKNQRTLIAQKKESRGKERRASALRTSIIIKIRMLKMESKDLNNLINIKSDQSVKCSCNDDNNSHQSTNTSTNVQTSNTTTSSRQNHYVQPDNHQSNIKANEGIEHLEDRINQINNDSSTAFVARRNQYNRSTNSINNNIVNDNEISNDSSDLRCLELEGKISSICDNITHVTDTESDRIQMELKNIGLNNYKKSNLSMNRECENRNVANAPFASPFLDRSNQNLQSSSSNTNVRTLNSASIHSTELIVNKTTTTPSANGAPDYVPMAPIKPSDKISIGRGLPTRAESESINSQRQSSLPVDEDSTICQTCMRTKDRNQMCYKCKGDAKEPKDKEPKSKMANWSKKFNCVKMLSPKSSSQIFQHPSSSKSSRQGGKELTNSIPKHSDVINAKKDLANDIERVAEPIKRLLDFDKFNPLEYPIEDCDETARAQRAREIHEGVDPPPGHRTVCIDPMYVAAEPTMDNLLANLVCSFDEKEPVNQLKAAVSNASMSDSQIVNTSVSTADAFPTVIDPPTRIIHSQMDFIHCLVPDLRQITNCGFYWGKMDRYEAERLLDGKPEGTFLLRDSAQEEFLFSVSFRKYGRSLHARIEQFNHKFSFDCHDPGVFTSSTVTGLLEHYKDPACVMFFEPALTQPLNRNFSFTLQQLCRSLIVSHTTYDGVNQLTLPCTLKSYLKEYHYKQRVRVKRYDQL